MINIKTQTGCWLDSEDSRKLIQHELNSIFSTFYEYFQCIPLYENPIGESIF